MQGLFIPTHHNPLPMASTSACRCSRNVSAAMSDFVKLWITQYIAWVQPNSWASRSAFPIVRGSSPAPFRRPNSDSGVFIAFPFLATYREEPSRARFRNYFKNAELASNTAPTLPTECLRYLSTSSAQLDAPQDRQEKHILPQEGERN